jgi:hypothetical protein
MITGAPAVTLRISGPTQKAASPGDFKFFRCLESLFPSVYRGQFALWGTSI